MLESEICFSHFVKLRLHMICFLPMRRVLRSLHLAVNQVKQEKRGRWCGISQFSGIHRAGPCSCSFPYLGCGEATCSCSQLWVGSFDTWILTKNYPRAVGTFFSPCSFLSQGRQPFGWPSLWWCSESHSRTFGSTSPSHRSLHTFKQVLLHKIQLSA